jgi:hypothetical protein
MEMFVAEIRQKVCGQTNNSVFCTGHSDMSGLCLFSDGFKLANLADYSLHSGRHKPAISVSV